MSSNTIKLPTGYFPPEGYVVSGSCIEGEVCYRLLRLRPRRELTLVFVDDMDEPIEFSSYFRECAGESSS